METLNIDEQWDQGTLDLRSIYRSSVLPAVTKDDVGLFARIPPDVLRQFGPSNLLRRAFCELSECVWKYLVLQASRVDDFNCAMSLPSLTTVHLLFAAARGDYRVLDKMSLETLASTTHDDIYGRSVIHAAAKRGRADLIVRLWHKHDIEIDATDHDSLTPLHYALLAGQHTTAALLLALEADPNAAIDKLTPIEFLAARGMWDGVALLMADKRTTVPNWMTATKKLPDSARVATKQRLVAGMGRVIKKLPDRSWNLYQPRIVSMLVFETYSAEIIPKDKPKTPPSPLPSPVPTIEDSVSVPEQQEYVSGQHRITITEGASSSLVRPAKPPGVDLQGKRTRKPTEKFGEYTATLSTATETSEDASCRVLGWKWNSRETWNYLSAPRVEHGLDTGGARPVLQISELRTSISILQSEWVSDETMNSGDGQDALAQFDKTAFAKTPLKPTTLVAMFAPEEILAVELVDGTAASEMSAAMDLEKLKFKRIVVRWKSSRVPRYTYEPMGSMVELKTSLRRILDSEKFAMGLFVVFEGMIRDYLSRLGSIVQKNTIPRPITVTDDWSKVVVYGPYDPDDDDSVIFNDDNPDNIPKRSERQLAPNQQDSLRRLTNAKGEHRNMILSDAMGMGKTGTATMFLKNCFAHSGPHLVVVPLNTLGSWRNELDNWDTYNDVWRTKGSIQVWHCESSAAPWEMAKLFCNDVPTFNVLLTTYEGLLTLKCADRINWRCIVIDEAHRLRNYSILAGRQARLLRSEFKLLLTGTPIHNDIGDMWTLLNFTNPDKFSNAKEFRRFSQVGSDADMAKEFEAVTHPYLIRHIIEQQQLPIPLKRESVAFIDMPEKQREWYVQVLKMASGVSTKVFPASVNYALKLREMCSHPFTAYPQLRTDFIATLKQPGQSKLSAWLGAPPSKNTPPRSGIDAQLEEAKAAYLKHILSVSGKMQFLDKYLSRMIQENGAAARASSEKKARNKLLVFCEFIATLDIVGEYLRLTGVPYMRIDGSSGDDRQELVKQFQDVSNPTIVFLISTHAGGEGITITAANNVIIYDCDWSIQNDEQAVARSYRIGQTRPVNIVRLAMHNTVDQRVLEFERSKLSIAYLGNGDFTIDRRLLSITDHGITPGHVNLNIAKCLEWAKRDLTRGEWPQHDIVWFYSRGKNPQRTFGEKFEGAGIRLDVPDRDYWPAWEAPEPSSVAEDEKAKKKKKKKTRAAKSADGPVESVAESAIVVSEKLEDGEPLDGLFPEPQMMAENKLGLLDVVRRGCKADVKLFDAYWSGEDQIRPEDLVDSQGFTIVHLALMGHHATNEIEMLSAVLARLNTMSPAQAATFVNKVTQQRDPKGLVFIPKTERTRFVTAGNITPLQQATLYNSRKAAELLLDYGADMGSQSKAVPPPMELATLFGYPDMVELFVQAMESKRPVSSVYWKLGPVANTTQIPVPTSVIVPVPPPPPSSAANTSTTPIIDIVPMRTPKKNQMGKLKNSISRPQ